MLKQKTNYLTNNIVDFKVSTKKLTFDQNYIL